MNKHTIELSCHSKVPVPPQPACHSRRAFPAGRQLLLAAGVLACSFASGWSQDVVIDNLSNSDEGNLAVLSSVYWANAFTTDSTDRYLGEIKVSLALPPNSTSDLKVDLWNDSANLPSSAVVSLSTGLNPTATGIFTYTPETPATLTANTTYWLALSVESGAGQYDWNSTLSATQTGVGTIGGVATYFGGSWIASPTSDKALFAVIASPVPEPSSLGLAAIVSIAGVMLRRPGFIFQEPARDSSNPSASSGGPPRSSDVLTGPGRKG